MANIVTRVAGLWNELLQDLGAIGPAGETIHAKTVVANQGTAGAAAWPVQIERKTSTVTVTIAINQALSAEIDMRGFSGGIVIMPAVWTAASLGFQVAGASGGTFAALYDSFATLVQVPSPTAALAYELPASLFAVPYLKLWSQNGAGVSTNQAAERSIIVCLKA